MPSLKVFTLSHEKKAELERLERFNSNWRIRERAKTLVEYRVDCFRWIIRALALLISAILVSDAFAMPPLQPLLIHSLRVGPHNILVVNTNGGLYLSTNAGVDWIPFKVPYLPWRTEGKGMGDVYITKPADFEKNTQEFLRWWVPSPGPLANDAQGGRYSCVGETIFKSIDGGMQWKATSSVPRPQGVLPPNLCVALLGVGNTIYAGTLHGIYKSIDFGLKWESAADVQTLREASVDAILADSHGNLFINARSAKIENGRATYKSVNSGAKWSILNFDARAVSENDVPKVVGTANQVIYASSFTGLIASTNHGDTWTGMNSGLNTPSKDDFIPWDVVSSVQQDGAGTLYATTPRQLYRLSAKRKTWLPLGRNGIPAFPGH